MNFKSYGIDGVVLHWLENWLASLVINGQDSYCLDLASDVPQGSVLGLVLFLICIYNIYTGMHYVILEFTEDVNLGNWTFVISNWHKQMDELG